MTASWLYISNITCKIPVLSSLPKVVRTHAHPHVMKCAEELSPRKALSLQPRKLKILLFYSCQDKTIIVELQALIMLV